MNPPQSVYSRFAATAAKFPDELALVTDEVQLTWQDLARRVEEMATRLDARGVGVGEHVAMMLGNQPEFVVAWLAVARAGAVLVPVNPDLRGESLRAVLEDCRAKRIVTTSGRLAEVGPDLTLDGVLEMVDPTDGPDKAPVPDPHPIPAGEPAAILYTSGTTGRPKGVVLSHRSYLAAGAEMAQAIGVEPRDRILICLPLFHANPQFYAVMTAFTCGASLALMPRFSASDFWAAAEWLGATAFTYVGTVLTILQRTTPPQRHRLRFCTGGGAPKATWDVIEDEFGIMVHELYGMTETGGFATINSRGRRQRGTCGTVRSDMQIAVLDEDDQELPSGTPGQIALRPRKPGVLFDRYYGLPELTLDRFRNLWFHTGDVGELDEDGYLTFLGRSDNVIRRGGENIAPAGVETALMKHPHIVEAAVIGVDDEVLGQEIQAFLVAAPGFDVDVWEVRDFLRRDLPRAEVPRYFTLVDSLPKTPTEKVRLDALRELRKGTVDTKQEREPLNG